MSIDFFELFKETVLISIAKRKIAEGVELTEEEIPQYFEENVYIICFCSSW